MALCLARKITRNFISNFGRSLATNAEAAVVATVPREEPKVPREVTTSKQYTICQPKPRVEQRPSTCGKGSEADIEKRNVEKRHLQPATLGEYYQPPVDLSAGTYPSKNASSLNQHKRFPESKTYTSVNLPLKGSKLANPFPEPVKVMPSHTVSDLEKADQMLADARLAKQTAPQNRPLMQPFVRNMSSSCKKGKKSDPCKKKCPKFCSEGCADRARENCVYHHVHKDCCKVHAPYPSYSETCAEELVDPHSECYMCPWKLEDHPTFKPPKKKRHYHTSATLFTPIKETDAVSKSTEPVKVPTLCAGWEASSIEMQGTKPPCLPPKTRCPPGTTKKLKKKKRKKKNKKKCDSYDPTVSNSMPALEMLEKPQLENVSEMNCILLKKKKKGKCQKWPFDNCIKKKNPCPKPECKKPKKEKPKDCPPECKVSGTETIEYHLEKCGQKKKKKCPKKKDDPCDRKGKPRTLYCPKNVWKKKKRPRQKPKLCYTYEELPPPPLNNTTNRPEVNPPK